LWLELQIPKGRVSENPVRPKFREPLSHDAWKWVGKRPEE
jgi:hypothetical protein